LTGIRKKKQWTSRSVLKGVTTEGAIRERREEFFPDQSQNAETMNSESEVDREGLSGWTGRKVSVSCIRKG